jgi:hypothetical protein
LYETEVTEVSADNHMRDEDGVDGNLLVVIVDMVDP